MHLVLKFWLWGRFVAEKQTYVLNLMAGHLIREHIIKTAREMPVKLDHYACKSSLGINYIL